MSSALVNELCLCFSVPKGPRDPEHSLCNLAAAGYVDAPALVFANTTPETHHSCPAAGRLSHMVRHGQGQISLTRVLPQLRRSGCDPVAAPGSLAGHPSGPRRQQWWPERRHAQPAPVRAARVVWRAVCQGIRRGGGPIPPHPHPSLPLSSQLRRGVADSQAEQHAARLGHLARRLEALHRTPANAQRPARRPCSPARPLTAGAALLAAGGTAGAAGAGGGSSSHTGRPWRAGSPGGGGGCQPVCSPPAWCGASGGIQQRPCTAPAAPAPAPAGGTSWRSAWASTPTAAARTQHCAEATGDCEWRALKARRHPTLQPPPLALDLPPSRCDAGAAPRCRCGAKWPAARWPAGASARTHSPPLPRPCTPRPPSFHGGRPPQLASVQAALYRRQLLGEVLARRLFKVRPAARAHRQGGSAAAPGRPPGPLSRPRSAPPPPPSPPAGGMRVVAAPPCPFTPPPSPGSVPTSTRCWTRRSRPRRWGAATCCATSPMSCGPH